MPRKNIAIFSSTKGSLAEAIINYSHEQYYHGKTNIYKVTLVVSNKETSGVVEVAKNFGVDVRIIDDTIFPSGEDYSTALIAVIEEHNIDLIVLAGFLRKIPHGFVTAYPGKIVNIHPALLPKFGGKGMYGMNVHRAVFEAKELFSGCTVHFVNEEYDEGAIIHQEQVCITNCYSPEDIQVKVTNLERQVYPYVIQELTQ
jgi:phosphoribosylglycinamide formyltransferase 1